MTVTERLLHYVSFDTQSDESSETCPSTAKQKLLGEALVEEMRALGIADARIDADGYVYGSVPGTPGAPAIGLIAHMDTSPDCSGRDIKPRIVEYTGGDIAHTGPADLGIHTGAKRHGQQQGGGAAFQMLCHIFPRQNARRCQAVEVGLQPDRPGRGRRQQRHGAFFQQCLGGRVCAAPGPEVPRRLCKINALRLFQPQRHTRPNAHLPALLYKNKE